MSQATAEVEYREKPRQRCPRLIARAKTMDKEGHEAFCKHIELFGRIPKKGGDETIGHSHGDGTSCVLDVSDAFVTT